MSNNIKIPFGLKKDGRIVYIHNKDYLNRDDYKDCYCYDCRGELVAKMGQERQWHFSHKAVDRKCSASIETWLHKYAKQIIKDNSVITIPALTANEYFENGGISDYFRNYIMMNRFTSKYQTIAVEKSYSGVRPDLVIRLENGTELAIEIMVTHGVDEIKKAKVKQSNFDMIEIYLDTENSFIASGELKEYILNEALRSWIYKTSNEELKKKEEEFKQKEREYLSKRESDKQENVQDNLLEKKKELEILFQQLIVFAL